MAKTERSGRGWRRTTVRPMSAAKRTVVSIGEGPSRSSGQTLASACGPPLPTVGSGAPTGRAARAPPHAASRRSAASFQ